MADLREGVMENECICCLNPIACGEANRIEAEWKTVGGLRMMTCDLVVCNACRGLDCEVLRPGGCKKPSCPCWGGHTCPCGRFAPDAKALKEFPA